MMERETGRSKGFGFVEMASDAQAQAAINGMNGQPLGGRSITVNEARPMEARPPRTGGFGGGGGGDRSGGGGGYGGGVAVREEEAMAVETVLAAVATAAAVGVVAAIKSRTPGQWQRSCLASAAPALRGAQHKRLRNFGLEAFLP
jgi:RNA recognition motif-containing protein